MTPQQHQQLRKEIKKLIRNEIIVENYNNDIYEDWKSTAAAGMIGLSTLLPQPGLSTPKNDIKPKYNDIQSSESIVDILKGYENSKNNPKGGYNKEKHKWYPHHSIEGGSKTIAYGHKILPHEDFDGGISDDEAITLLKRDIVSKITLAKRKMPKFDLYPVYVKNAIINALYRGDLGPKTIKLINDDKWINVSSEYLNHPNYKSGPSQIKNRMAKNAEAFSHYKI